ncbi:hypothetical protein BIFCAT_01206 [Bifidobacterium catenulatum DSM 16992 = JCM 1194 = LMG 11043]|uniref:Uncharacterized protein n=1 Tax=Bifidobacterium catenulatum DSM 16992 = JCM 1194 = LMG 11043 TaxID=566552 RepID=B6XVH7_9BIFI|nr:hypothetical protein BIFCAT_01206 [Bifidobacterium catenulatum DSM 16992 = JCM 1194 = LMG 11043]
MNCPNGIPARKRNCQVWTGMPDRFLQGFSGSLTLDDRSSMTVDSSPLRY